MEFWSPPLLDETEQQRKVAKGQQYGFSEGLALGLQQIRETAEQEKKQQKAWETTLNARMAALETTLTAQITDIESRLSDANENHHCGYLTRAIGVRLEAKGISVPLGELCEIQVPGKKIMAVVIGFEAETTLLMPLTPLEAVTPGAKIRPLRKTLQVPVGPALLGRVIDGLGQPLDQEGPLPVEQYRSIYAKPQNPLARVNIQTPLDLGVKAINALFTVGLGQSLGIFADSGLGKSALLGTMAKTTQADVVVVGLIGERGREVQTFIQHHLAEQGLKRAVVVATPADHPAILRLNSANVAITLAEYFRDQGLNVLLLMDSLTRIAQAQRELGLSRGELSVAKGYPPSVFGLLPSLTERLGCFDSVMGKGSITGIFTILTDGDAYDPIAESAKAVLDGHIVLSRELAELGHYPAIDIEASLSRVMPQVVSKAHWERAQRIKRWHALYRENRDLMIMGAYTSGVDPELDQAIQKHQEINDFLRQNSTEKTLWAEMETQMTALVGEFT